MARTHFADAAPASLWIPRLARKGAGAHAGEEAWRATCRVVSTRHGHIRHIANHHNHEHNGASGFEIDRGPEAHTSSALLPPPSLLTPIPEPKHEKHSAVGGKKVPSPYLEFMEFASFTQLDFVKWVPFDCM